MRNSQVQIMNILKRLLPMLLVSVIAAVVLVIMGVSAVNAQTKIEYKESSYKLTSFDYVVSAPSAEQVNEIKEYPSVTAVFPCYNLTFSSLGISVMFCDSLTDYNIGLFAEKTLLSGNADASGIMLDRTAADKLKKNVGDTVTLNMLGTSIPLKVSGIYMASTYTNYTNGLGLAVFPAQMRGKYKYLQYSMMFVDVNDEAAFESSIKGYKPYGELKTQEEYIENYKKTQSTRPIEYETDEEWEENVILPSYNTYKANWEAGIFANSVQKKAVVMQDVADQVASTQDKIDNVSVAVALGCAAAFLAVALIYIFFNSNDDTVVRKNGMPLGKRLVGNYVIPFMLLSFVVALITFISLTVCAVATDFMSSCVGIICLFSLPIFVAGVLSCVAAYIRLRLLYADGTKVNPQINYGSGNAGGANYTDGRGWSGYGNVAHGVNANYVPNGERENAQYRASWHCRVFQQRCMMCEHYRKYNECLVEQGKVDVGSLMKDGRQLPRGECANKPGDEKGCPLWKKYGSCPITNGIVDLCPVTKISQNGQCPLKPPHSDGNTGLHE